MDAWSLILLFFSLSLSLVFLFLIRRKPPASRDDLPPGPLALPVIGNLFWLRRSFSEIEGVLRSLRARYGPIVTLHLGSRRTIFVSDRALVHKILVQHGAAFADRPPAPFTDIFVNSSQKTINSAHYGATWRVLRRNLAAEILHPSRVKLCAGARERVLKILLGGLQEKADAGEPVVVVESFQYAMFCLLVFMCFGEMLDERGVREVEKVQRDFLLYLSKLAVFRIFPPGIARFVFGNRLRTIQKLRHGQEVTFFPLIRARRRLRDEKGAAAGGENTLQHSYVDSLLDLEIPGDGGENRSLTEGEIVSLCSELLNAGSDTTSTSLQWIMANLVKHRHIQEKLFEEIASVVGGGDQQAREEELGRMPYLKAVVMEGLRRHPPGHFLLPHAAVEETAVDGYVIPRNAALNFVVTEINWDESVWERPMEFRPERFLAGGEGEGVDITGSKGVTMMPFGVGRRICPGMALALLHLEYFVANLVWAFEWNAVAGEDVDLTEKSEFTVVLKHPLKACISPRRPPHQGPKPK